MTSDGQNHHADVNLDHLQHWIDLCIAEGWGGFEATAWSAHDEIVRRRKAADQHQRAMQDLDDRLWDATVSVLRDLPMNINEYSALITKLDAKWKQARAEQEQSNDDQ